MLVKTPRIILLSSVIGVFFREQASKQRQLTGTTENTLRKTDAIKVAVLSDLLRLETTFNTILKIRHASRKTLLVHSWTGRGRQNSTWRPSTTITLKGIRLVRNKCLWSLRTSPAVSVYNQCVNIHGYCVQSVFHNRKAVEKYWRKGTAPLAVGPAQAATGSNH